MNRFVVFSLPIMLFMFVAGCGKTATTDIATTTQIEAVSEATRIEPTTEAKTAMVPVLEYPDSVDDYVDSVHEGRYLTNEEVVTVFDGAVIDGDNLIINDEIAVCPVAYCDSDGYTAIYGINQYGSIQEYLTNGAQTTVGFIHIDTDKLPIEIAYDLIKTDIKQCTIRILDTGEIQVWSWGERIS